MTLRIWGLVIVLGVGLGRGAVMPARSAEPDVAAIRARMTRAIEDDAVLARVSRLPPGSPAFVATRKLNTHRLVGI